MTVYDKTVWTDNETPISAANMNKIENGIGDAHDTLNAATSAATADVIVKRDASGRMKAAAPVASDDVALKSTVDTHAAITTAPVHGSTSAATPNTLAHRDANGQINVGTPTASNHIITKGYVDPHVTYYVPSDNVLLSLPTERTGVSSYKQFNIAMPGKYRIKGEYKSSVSGNSAAANLRYGLTPGSAGSGSGDSISTSSDTYATFSIDTPFLPGNSIIILIIVASGAPIMSMRNVTLCGDPVIGTTNTFNGTD